MVLRNWRIIKGKVSSNISISERELSMSELIYIRTNLDKIKRRNQEDIK